MINSLAINENKQKQVVGNIVNDIYLLPHWEIIRPFTITEKQFLFFKKPLNVNLLHKFSSKNMLEKYSVRTMEGKTLVDMDLRIYKDSVYIVNLEIKTTENIQGAVEKLIQTAIEKAIDNTTEKEIFISLTSDQSHRGKIKRILSNNGFELEENQSGYEKRMFGEIFKLSAKNDKYINESIKQEPFLINE